MSADHLTFTAATPEDTARFGEALGRLLKPGDLITLRGELGSGKTALTQGIARGIGVPDDYYVTSPTYAIVHEYPAVCPLFHLDLYRLSGPDDLEAIGFDELLEAGGIIVIEWPDRLPPGYLTPSADVHVTVEPDESRSFLLSNYGLDLQDLINLSILNGH